MFKKIFAFLPLLILFFSLSSNALALELTPEEKAVIADKIRKEASILEPERDIKEINENMDDFISVYTMYKEYYPEMTEEELIEDATSNILSKLDFVVDHEEFNRITAVTSRPDEPSGYDYIEIYINENLNLDYDATGDDAVERNVAILKENMDKLPEDFKESAMLYIEDMELGMKVAKRKEERELREKIEMRAPNLDKKKEKENALAAVAYSKEYWKDPNKNYPKWKQDCANFISQCLVAGKKEMRNKSKDIESSINWFSFGNKADINKVSSTWRGADMFKWHWNARAYDYKDFDLSKKDAVSAVYDYAHLGSPVLFIRNDKHSTATHTLIVAELKKDKWTGKKDVGMRNHTGPSDDKNTGIRWLSGVGSRKIRVYKIYKY